MRYLFFALTAALLTFSGASHAVYRCDVDGKTSYSDQPCASGRKLDIADAPPDAASNARRIEKGLAASKKELRQLEAQRRKHEAEASRKRQRAERKQAAMDRRCDSLERRQRWARDDAAAATGKASDKARKKAQRATEVYEGECGAGKRVRPLQSS
ncbi:DUF4124 domain-containing protein [Noviherbaspirillum aerium]|uniref:DUF4124 domain-containing protein n=1 Tax=Noviherbaspirillum aerium TaxID=2588497 RepID=UPI00124EC2AC|nr:DUF4124 domain-containing protein [Noviherbaspirillum aerium]